MLLVFLILDGIFVGVCYALHIHQVRRRLYVFGLLGVDLALRGRLNARTAGYFRP